MLAINAMMKVYTHYATGGPPIRRSQAIPVHFISTPTTYCGSVDGGILLFTAARQCQRWSCHWQIININSAFNIIKSV